MQKEFLQQVSTYQELMAKCYPGARMELEFSRDDVLRFFSEIAMQH